MIEKLKTGLWYLRNPAFWRHGMALVVGKLTNARRHALLRDQATAWAAERAVSAEEALTRLGVYDPATGAFPAIPDEVIREAEANVRSARVQMGGPADLELLYAAVVLATPKAAIETGVAYGWSSAIILAAMESNGTGRLVSVDMPYAKRNNEPWVGVAVAERLRHRWRLIRKPDRGGIGEAIAASGGAIDLCHYDSDKSYPGRMYAYPRLWAALRPGGLFISDDIQDNFGFRDFCARNSIEFQVTSSGGKYIGVARKAP
jgi:predicted O-methyltransferase YrrM